MLRPSRKRVYTIDHILQIESLRVLGCSSRQGEGWAGERGEGQCSPMLQNFPSQPSLQKHCHGSSQSPLTQPGAVTHLSHRGPSQPISHLCEQRGERGAHEESRGSKEGSGRFSAGWRTLGSLRTVPGQWVPGANSSHLHGKLREGGSRAETQGLPDPHKNHI